MQYGVGINLLGAPNFWLEVIVVYITTFSMRFLERSIRWLYFPNDSMILAEAEVLEERAARGQRGAKSAESALEMAATTPNGMHARPPQSVQAPSHNGSV